MMWCENCVCPGAAPARDLGFRRHDRDKITQCAGVRGNSNSCWNGIFAALDWGVLRANMLLGVLELTFKSKEIRVIPNSRHQPPPDVTYMCMMGLWECGVCSSWYYSRCVCVLYDLRLLRSSIRLIAIYEAAFPSYVFTLQYISHIRIYHLSAPLHIHV